MAIVIESVSTNSTWNSGSTTITKPSGLAVGDLMVGVIGTNQGTGAITRPSGWTTIVELQRDIGDYDGTNGSYYKVAEASDVAA